MAACFLEVKMSDLREKLRERFKDVNRTDLKPKPVEKSQQAPWKPVIMEGSVKEFEEYSKLHKLPF